MTVSRPPATLFIELTSECNYHCRYCHMWALEDAPTALSETERSKIIQEFAELSPAGEVVFTGGETMKNWDQFFALVKLCRKLGLRSATNTNGSFIQPGSYDFVVEEGPDYLVVSLDSHLAAVHDYNRGVPGSFETTIATLSGLVEAKRRAPSKAQCEVLTNTVLLDNNIGALLPFLGFISALGVDGATFQILSPTFHKQGSRDVFYEKHFFRDKPFAIDALHTLARRREEFPILRTSANDIRWMQQYILTQDHLPEAVCASHERNIMIDHRGDIQLCFNMRKILSGRTIGNVRTTPISQAWLGEDARAARQVMETCRLSCGMLNCHRRLPP